MVEPRGALQGNIEGRGICQRTGSGREIALDASFKHPTAPSCSLVLDIFRVNPRVQTAVQRHTGMMEPRVLEARIQKQFAPAAGSLADPSALDVALESPRGSHSLRRIRRGENHALNCNRRHRSPDSGRVTASGTILFDAERRVCLPAAQRRVGYVFQDLSALSPPHGGTEYRLWPGQVGRQEQKSRTGSILSSFRIEHLRLRKPAQISGGERQRIALARALVTDPRVLLLDELWRPLTFPRNHSSSTILRRWNEEHRVPILYVTHSRDEVFALGERVLVLDRGRIIAQGTPHDVMTTPRLETVAQLLGFENIFDALVEWFMKTEAP